MSHKRSLMALLKLNAAAAGIILIASPGKVYLRKVKARTKELLETPIADVLDIISVSDILGWFAEDG
jgi:hypothetical protein